MVRIVINGAGGRMGRAVAEAAGGFPEAVISGALERPGHPGLGELSAPGVPISEDAGKVIAEGGVVIDFSTPEGFLACLEACRRLGKGLVTGTTGFGKREREALEAAASEIPVFFSPNMCWGVNVLFRLAGQAALLLPGHEVEVVEVHHDRKLDAPSGTALRLAEIVSRARGGDPEAEAVHGRSGRVSKPRDPREIGIHALRLGSVVGEHTVIFGSGAERLEIAHRAGSRLDFAAGAVRAALFLAGREPGLYGMDDLFRAATG